MDRVVKTLLLFLAAFVAVERAQPADAAIAKTFATALNMPSGGTPAASRTTGTFDASSQTQILVCGKWESGDTTVTPTSTAVSGSWTSHTKEIVSTSSDDLVGQCFSATITSATTGRTATLSFAASRTFITVAVWLINSGSGTISLISEDNDEGSGTGIDAGTLSNGGGVGVVSFMVMLEYSGSTHTGAAGWTEDFDFNGSGGDNFTAGYSRGSETTTSIDPSGTQSMSAAWGALSLMFGEGAAGGGVKVNALSGRGGGAAQPVGN